MPKINQVEIWLDNIDTEDALAFKAYCRETQSLQATIAYLVQYGGEAAAIPITEVKSFLEGLKGSEAKLYDRENLEYLGVNLSGVLDRMVIELSDQISLFSKRIDGTLDSAHPLMDEMTVRGAMSEKNSLMKELRAVVEQLDKRRAKTDKSSVAWAVAARLQQIFMSRYPVRDSEHESWLKEHWSGVLAQFEDEIESLA